MPPSIVVNRVHTTIDEIRFLFLEEKTSYVEYAML